MELARHAKNLRDADGYARKVRAQPHSRPFIQAIIHAVRPHEGQYTVEVFTAWWQRRWHHIVPRLVIPTLADVQAWQHDHSTDGILREPITAAQHRARFHARVFRLEHRTVQWMLLQNTKGIAVPSGALRTKYLQGWHSLIGQDPLVDDHLQKFTRKNYQNKWVHALRKQ